MIELPVPPGRLLRSHDVDRPDCRRDEPGPACPSSPESPSAQQIGGLMILGVIVGNAIAFAIDPHGSWAALADIFRSFGS